MPEWAATAAPVHRIAAPGYVDDPAITPVTPWLYLSSARPGMGQRAATSAASNPRTSEGGRSSPMSTSSTLPQRPSACTGLSPPNVTVSAASTWAPSAAPVCTSRPLGRSTATTGMPACSTTANTWAAFGRNAPEPEMPTTPSITRSVAAGTVSAMRPPAARNAASALGWALSGLSRTAQAPAPRRFSSVAAHSASPPLSPEPTTAHTVRPLTVPSSRMIAVVSPNAARRISTPSGSEASNGASASRICWAV